MQVGLQDSGYDVITKELEKDKQNDDKIKWHKIYGEAIARTMFINPTLKAVKQHVSKYQGI